MHLSVSSFEILYLERCADVSDQCPTENGANMAIELRGPIRTRPSFGCVAKHSEDSHLLPGNLLLKENLVCGGRRYATLGVLSKRNLFGFENGFRVFHQRPRTLVQWDERDSNFTNNLEYTMQFTVENTAHLLVKSVGAFDILLSEDACNCMTVYCRFYALFS